MNNTETLAISREKITVLIQFITLVGVATIVPLFHQQTITGPVINATLFVSTMLLGFQAGIIVGLVPSIIALSAGLLPPVLTPMIPFIMVGNAILVVTFNVLKDRNYWLGVILASILKFAFLSGTSLTVVNLLLKKEIARQAAIMMSWPQLLTAIAGGVLAYLFVKFYKRSFCC
ncbi:MAG TPA: iron hydrogenase [Candidatus Bathyarchaeia archaeon]|nr:iron hydrogenase [Candidatus Bathyarchaeia archaeon]